jgi:NADH-quinone oxidoreductase subunit L
MDLAWFLLIAPLAAAAAILVHLWRKPNMAVFASVGSAAICFLIALGVNSGSVPAPDSWDWISFPAYGTFPGFVVDVGMIFDPLSKGMLLVVTGVGLLVHIYSIGYMAHDPGRARFFGGLSIFMFSMTGIVLATNLIMMFFFWEGVGLSSYLLIGFWFTRESAARAANKAFVCNRLADFGFMIGILTMWSIMGTMSVKPADLSQLYYQGSQVASSQSASMPETGYATKPNAGEMPRPARPLLTHPGGGVTTPSTFLLTVMVLGLFLGCVGKSAMFPFHVWLPDAMEGPTPVSALIHAATMVAAGVYMLCRVYPLLVLSPHGMMVIASVGCFTAIFAALIAIQQNDIKRILAYSTLSQLGYMVMAVGCGGPAAAMFHLTTHAFFKALLFLAAGSVIHALHEEQDIWRMGGLARKIPLTFWTFAIGTLALIGCPGFAGSFSKDFVLSVAYAYHPIFYWVGVFTAFLTAFYMTRLVIVAFFGSPHTAAAEHPHESPKVMTIPLILLAIPSFLAGYSFFGIKNYFHAWAVDLLRTTGQIPNDGRYVGLPEIGFFLGDVMPALVVVIGVGLAFVIYRDQARDPLHIRVLAHKFYIDEFYDRDLVGGQQMLAGFLSWIDSWILDGVILRGAAYLSVGVGELLKLFQTGSLQTYTLLFSLGGVLLIYFTLYAR